MGAIRFYLGSASDGALPLPQANGSWTASSSTLARRGLWRKSTVSGIASTESWTTGQTKAHRYYVIDTPLRAGPVTGTVKCYIPGSESNANMNIYPRFELYVVSADLSTVRGTLLSIANYGSGNEVATTQTGIAFADGDTMTRVDAQAGDYIVAVPGGTDVSGTTPGLSLYYGGTDADCLEDETTTGDQAAWIEFSDDTFFISVPKFLGYVCNPVDSGTATNTADPTAVTPISGLQVGDLIIMIGQQRATSATLAISQASGQSWAPLAAVNNTNTTVRLFWCRFNGTWGSDPSIDFSAATCNTVYFAAFRPSQSTMEWAVDQALVELDFTAGSSPFTKTITGQTTTKANTVTVAVWATPDDNTWNTLGASTPWTVPNAGVYQQRNTSGSDQSMCFAYKIQPIAGSTGNVSLNQATLGGDAGTTLIVTFYEYAPSVGTLSAPTINTSFNGTTGNISLSSITVTAGNLLLYAVCQYDDDGAGAPTIGDPSVPSGLCASWTLVDSAYNNTFAGSAQGGGVWVYWGIATTGTTLTQTLHASHTVYRGVLMEVPGGYGIGVHAANTATSSSNLDVSLSGALPTSVSLAFVYASGGNGADPRSGWTELQDITTWLYFETQYKLPADTTASGTPTFGGSRDIVIVACEVQAQPLPGPQSYKFPTVAVQRASAW